MYVGIKDSKFISSKFYSVQWANWFVDNDSFTMKGENNVFWKRYNGVILMQYIRTNCLQWSFISSG
jgi:hypothetical protein